MGLLFVEVFFSRFLNVRWTDAILNASGQISALNDSFISYLRGGISFFQNW